MTALYLWLSIFSFMALFVAIIINLFAWVQRTNRSLTLLLYTFLQAITLSWLILFTILYFTEVYMSPLTLGIKSAMGIVRMGVSAGILYILTLMSQNLLNPNRLPAGHLAGGISGGVYIISVILLLNFTFPIAFTSWIQVTYYSYCLYWVIRVLANRNMLKSITLRNSAIVPFYMIFCVYAVVSIANSFPALLTNPSGAVQVLPRALYAMAWGVGEIVISLLRRYRLEQGLTDFSEFYREFKLTEREREIADRIFSGESNREIAGNLFISEKTVETHIYNIFRKCSVKSRVELLNTARRIQLRDFP